ncbi:MAG: endonuclease NucS [Actinomycetota bacterium]
MRILVADCSITYAGRLHAFLPSARRLILIKDDGTVVVHADRGHKALNWMSPPCSLTTEGTSWRAVGAKGETLDIEITAIISDETIELGSEPGLVKTGTEIELQALLAASCETIEDGLRLVQREFPTDLGPVDMLCRDADGGAVAVEVKRVGELAAIEQLSRYLERMQRDPMLRPVRGILVAQVIKPQTKVLAAARGISCVEVDFEILSGMVEPEPTLFDAG